MDAWPLVGRTEELEFLASVIADASQAGIVVAGGAGVGKTRLMREAVTTAAADGCHVEMVTATESARRLPFGAFAHQLPPDLGAIDRVDLLAVIGRHLVGRGGSRPIVLAVDDVHLLDELSAALVHHVATSGVATVIMTLRSGEASSDALVALLRDGVVPRLELQPVSRSEFDAVVEAALGGPTDHQSLDRMWTLTEGNILFARELIGDIVGAGGLTLEHGLWRWNGGLGGAVRLRETVAGRLGSLNDAERYTLDVLAVGEPLAVSVLERLSDAGTVADSVSVSVSVVDLERRGLISVEVDGPHTDVRLAHPLMGETLRAEMPRLRTLDINRRLAVEEAARGADRDALKLALWQEASGEVCDPTMALEAARMANARSDYVLAERMARMGLDGGGGDGVAAVLELGQALNGQYRFADAESLFVELVGRVRTDTERHRLADSLALAVGYGGGKLREAIDMLASLEVQIADPVMKAMVQGQRAAILTVEARFAEAAELGTLALASVNDDGVRLRALASVGISLVMSGHIDEALALSEEAIPAAARVRDRLPRASSWALSARVSALSFAGRTAEAIDLIYDSLEGSSPSTAQSIGSMVTPLRPSGNGNGNGNPFHGSWGTVATAHGYLGIFALVQGRPRSAVRLLNDAALRLRSSSSNLEPSWIRSRVAEAHALLGELPQARQAAQESLSLRRDEALTFRPDELRALAWVDAQDGRLSAAIEQLWKAANLAAERGQVVTETIILGDLLRLGEATAAARGQQVAAGVDGAWAAAIATHASAAISGDVIDVEAAAVAFEAIGHLLVAAELWAAASAGRQREGLAARATEGARKSRELAGLCEGAQTAPLTWAIATVPLSRRERETAEMAAKGATNAQIAETLTVSIRTVESHLYAAFAKLGVTDRSQLSQALQAE